MIEIQGQVILGTADLSGNRPAETSSLIDLVDRFPTPMEIASVFNDAAAAGVDAVVTLNQVDILVALNQARRTFSKLRVYPIIPNVIGYVREATDYGLVGAARRRIQQMAMMDLMRIGVQSVLSAPRVLKRDFNTLMSILFDVELASFKSLEPSIVFLHPQITDLALAFGNRDLFQLYFKVMRGRFGVEPGLATNNFGWLLPRLNEWGLQPGVVLTPFNPRGFLMKPTQAACEQLLLSKSGTLIADQVDTAPYSDDDVRNYFRKHGIRAAILEFHDDATLATRVRTLKSCLV